jgi:hypothetical protein
VLSPPPPIRAQLRSIAGFIVLAALFAIAYAQSPLYTSNQNQYFLHGFSAAGYGYLAQDWLANTQDPTPLFSKLVELTIRYFKWEYLFYGYYALMMGVYLSSLYAIADLFFLLRTSRLKSLLFISLFITIHSAGFRFALSRWLGINWTFVFEDGVADQRMLGPVFQPSVFGVLLALSLYLQLSGRSYTAVLVAAIGVAFHPTYLLGAAMLILSYGIADWMIDRRVGRPIRYGLVAFLLVSPTLIYVSTAFLGSSPQVAAQAREILVQDRIPHHALISQWLDATVVFKISLVCAAYYLAARLKPASGQTPVSNRLAIILMSSSVIAVFLTAVQAFTGNNALALVFPWRISILLVPLSTTLLLAFIVDRFTRFLATQSTTLRHMINLASTVVIFLSVLVGGIRFMLDIQRRQATPERALESFIYAHKSPGEIYLIPVKMQDFRLETGSPAYVDFKSIPYRDADVLEWRRRLRLADKFYSSYDCALLDQLSRQEGITHVVLPAETPHPICPSIDVTYQDDAYILARTR